MNVTAIVGVMVGLIVLVAVVIPTTIGLIADNDLSDVQSVGMQTAITNEVNHTTATGTTYYFAVTGADAILSGSTAACDNATTSAGATLTATVANSSYLTVTTPGEFNASGISCNYTGVPTVDYTTTDSLLPLLVLFLAVGGIVLVAAKFVEGAF